MTIVTKYLLIFSISVFSFFGCNAQDFYSYNNSLKYANSLFHTGQYSSAATEYQRVLFLNPNDTISRLKLVKSYRLAGNTVIAKKELLTYCKNQVGSLYSPFAREYFKLLIIENDTSSSRLFLHNDNMLPSNIKSGYTYGLLLMQSKWDMAQTYRTSNSDMLIQYNHFNDLRRIELDGLDEKYKNKWLSSGLSTIVPGLGKVYNGQWKDAIYSFLYVSAGAFLTYKSYKNNQFNRQTIIIGSITSGLYLVNIYGSHKGASYYNQKKNHYYKHAVEDFILND